MYTTVIDGEDYAVKPMNCPGGMLVYKQDMHSYRDLPMRVAEIGLVHRHEKSGALHGLMRVRCFNQDDAHIFGKREQEIAEILRFYRRTFGVQFVCFHQSFDDTAYIFAIFGIHFFDRQDMCLHYFVKHDADQTRTFHADFFGYDNCRL